MISRRKLLIGAGGAIALGVGGRTAAAAALSYGDGHPGLKYRFGSLEEAMTKIRALTATGPVKTSGAWSWAQILTHNAQGIEYSLAGYPEPKPAAIRVTVGKLVHAHFAHQGYMKHDLTAVIPGAPALGEPTAEEALVRLEAAVAKFQSHPGEYAPHFVYDALTRAEYDRIHAMHLANHFSEIAG